MAKRKKKNDEEPLSLLCYLNVSEVPPSYIWQQTKKHVLYS